MTARWWYVSMLLFSAIISNDNFNRQIHEETRHTILYDEHKNPIKIVVESWQVQVPIVDGIPYHDQADVYYLKQEFTMQQPASACQTAKPIFQVIKPKIVCNTYAPTQAPCVLQRPDLPKESGFYFQARPAQHWPTSFEMLSQKEFTALYLRLLDFERIYWHYFHMSPDDVDVLLKLSFNSFEQRLLSFDIIDEAVCYLLRRYLKKRKWNYSGEKQELEQHVLEALEKRNTKKQREAQKILQQKLQEERKLAEQELLEEKKRKQAYQKVQEEKRMRYEHESINDWDYCDSLPQDLYDTRQQALEQSKIEQYASYEKDYNLGEQALGYLVSENIDFRNYEHFCGTALQQQFHQEICQTFHQVALQTLYHKQPVNFTKQAFLFAQAAYETNKKDWIAIAGAMSDIAQQLWSIANDMHERPYEYIQVLAYGIDRYAQAILQGVDETILESMDMLANPDIALHNLVHLGASIGYAFYRVLDLAATAHIAHIFDDNAMAQEAYKKEAQRMKQDLAILQKNIAQQIAETDGPGRVKFITKIGTNFFVPPITANAFGMHFKGAAVSGALGVAEQALFDVAQDAVLAQDLQAVGVASTVAQQEVSTCAVSKFAKAQETLQKSTASKIKNGSLQSSKKIGPVRKLTQKPAPKPIRPAIAIKAASAKPYLKKISSYKKGIIPYTESVFKNKFAKVLESIVEEWENSCGQSLKELENLMYRTVLDEKGQTFRINLSNIKHVTHFDYKFFKLPNGWKLQITGGHAPGICKFLQKKGLITIQKTKKLKNGRIKYTCKETATGRIFIKTEFPETWSWRKIAESGWKVFDNGVEKVGEKGISFRALQVDYVKMSVIVKHHEKCSNIENIVPYVIKSAKIKS